MRTSLWADFKRYVLYSGNTLNHLVAINIAIYLLFVILYVILSLFSVTSAPFEALYHWLSFPVQPFSFITRPWTIITYQFIHEAPSPWHLVFNMIMLLFSGRIFREYLGDKKLLAVYILGGMAGAILFMAGYQILPAFALYRASSTLYGASASIVAILTAITTLLPEYTVFLVIIGPVRLIYIWLVFMLLYIIGLAGGNAGGNFAHLGGAAMGFIYIKVLKNGTDIGAWITKIQDWTRNLFKKKSHLKVKYYSEAPSPKRTPKSNRVSQEEVDIILDKIAQSGYDSLSQPEKETLLRASKEN